MTVDLNELVTKADIAQMLDVSRERVTQLAQRDDFPASLGQVGKSLVWSRRDIERWSSSWDRRGGRPRSAKSQ